MTASHTPELDIGRLNRDVAVLAARARPGVLGVGLMNLESGQNFTFEGARPFPMQDVFELPLGAAVLAEVDGGRLALSETLEATADTLSPFWSPIADAWPARATYTVEELLHAAVGDSDSTAADLLMRRIGGPGAVTAWLQSHQVMEVRVDRYVRQLLPESLGMASFRATWKGRGALLAALSTVPPAQRRAAGLAYLRDPRDTATPRGMLNLLAKLESGELLSTASARRLLTIMAAGSRGAERLKSGLPKDARFAHEAGAPWPDQGLSLAYNDVGIFTLKSGLRYATAAFLAGSTMPSEQRAALFADLGRVMGASLG